MAFVSGFLRSAERFQGPPVRAFFLWGSDDTPLSGGASSCLSIRPLVDLWVVSSWICLRTSSAGGVSTPERSCGSHGASDTPLLSSDAAANRSLSSVSEAEGRLPGGKGQAAWREGTLARAVRRGSRAGSTPRGAGLLPLLSSSRCLDEAEKALRPSVPQVPECPICGKPFLRPKSRLSHLKQCAARMEVGPQLLLQAVRLQTAQPEGASSTPAPR